ncbi:DUF3037 domain-containing protein [Pedobacter yulinensis]|uniref:DUF3037 domain-containing protein n=1 Tax=Pedobacter yulinensis TaxID=2126353 RepID=A0A2T3HLS5_9SPHI|nr:DUF3037 domain-containing protein [Pedobacter yulinensis]PST83390.1 DUF3037 domain-containing protein [Pedobacter yulinensis]
MQEELFEYAVIRLVPRVEREEFINVGVVLYCARAKFLQTKTALAEERLSALSPETDAAEIHTHLETFCLISEGRPCGSPIAELDAASRFRWLTATRSTILQCSKVHPGFTASPAETLSRLFSQLVG